MTKTQKVKRFFRRLFGAPIVDVMEHTIAITHDTVSFQCFIGEHYVFVTSDDHQTEVKFCIGRSIARPTFAPVPFDAAQFGKDIETVAKKIRKGIR
jgi:hypothetical protein